LAFRTFGVFSYLTLNGLINYDIEKAWCLNFLTTLQLNGYGIDSMAEIFLDFGYTRKDELRFPAKKLKAYWFSPPTASFEEGSGINGPLPRVFISELRVDQMSSEAQVHLLIYILKL